MADTPLSTPPSVEEVRARLRDVAQTLRQGGSIDPESQRTLAELVDELNRTLGAGPVPPVELAQLAQSTAHLAETLHKDQGKGILSSARDRLEQAAVNAEAHAPVVVGLARRLLETLANIGI
jgi:hypothetical protein